MSIGVCSPTLWIPSFEVGGSSFALLEANSVFFLNRLFSLVGGALFSLSSTINTQTFKKYWAGYLKENTSKHPAKSKFKEVMRLLNFSIFRYCINYGVALKLLYEEDERNAAFPLWHFLKYIHGSILIFQVTHYFS